jgi:predicted GIY-YIG superfamily endonuclease
MEKIQGWHRLLQFNESWVIPIPAGTSGVYVIHEFNRPLYVGRSGDIRRRLLEHLAGRGNRYITMALKNYVYLTFTYLELASEQQAEKALIAALGGPTLPGVGPSNLANLVSGSDPEDRYL